VRVRRIRWIGAIARITPFTGACLISLAGEGERQHGKLPA
jgi:hypothetical protein